MLKKKKTLVKPKIVISDLKAASAPNTVDNFEHLQNKVQSEGRDQRSSTLKRGNSEVESTVEPLSLADSEKEAEINGV